MKKAILLQGWLLNFSSNKKLIYHFYVHRVHAFFAFGGFVLNYVVFTNVVDQT